MTISHIQEPYRLPIVVGVTGHRFLSADTETRVRESIVRIFDELDQFSGGHIQVMSSLAEGADRIFAEIALNRGYKCTAPLPMSPDEYEKDFADAESRKTFRLLLEQCDWHIAAPLCTSCCALDPRDSAYLAAGHAVTAQSHVLIALWDGKAGLPGGTSDIVTCSLDSSSWVEHMDVDRLTNTNECVVYHIKTPRVDDVHGSDTGAVRRLIPIDWTTETCDKDRNNCEVEVKQKTVQDLLLPIAVFNSDAAKHTKLDQKQISAILHTEFYTNTQKNASATPNAFLHGVGMFLTLDRLATHFQTMTRRHVLLRLGLLVLGMGIFETFTGPLHPNWIWILGSLFFVGAAMLGWPRIRRDLDQRFVDYRVLCECMRVFLYLQMAGIRDIHPAQCIRYQGRGLDWVKLALCGLHRETDAHGSLSLENMKHLQEKWVQSQLAYFRNATLKESKLRRRITAASAVMLACAIILVVIAMTQMESTTKTATELVSYGLLGVITMLLFIGALQTYAGYRAYKEHVNRFAIMENAFATADRDLTNALARSDLQRAERIIRHIAVLALQEVSDWLILHRERPPEISPV